MNRLISYILVVSLAFSAFLVVPAQVVNTTLGTVQGFTLTSRNNRNFSAFLGIPFARPPVLNLRFQAPMPKEPWNGIFDASTYGNVCPQYIGALGTGDSNITGDEDCLTINVFTPYNLNLITEEEALLPVLVYIHGGYFMILSGSNYGPRYFMDHDVILVTFNFRLGAFGFLSTLDNNSPGNAGMKDQILALKWVRDNVGYFGGDASKVTIYGESAGAVATHFLMLSPMSEGLFSAAISGSGSAFKVMSVQTSPLEVAQTFAAEVGCADSIGNNTEMVTCLRTLNASTIAAATNEWAESLKDPLKMFCPSLEANTRDAFLTRHPYEIIVDRLQQAVPWMVGINSGEGTIVTLGIYESDDWTNEINTNWSTLSHRFLLYNQSDSNLTNSIKTSYLNLSASDNNIDFRRDMQGFTNLFSDRLYIDASLEAARLQADIAPVFLYFNDYATESNSMGVGTIHGEELQLLFSPANFSAPLIAEGHPDYEQSMIMVDLWVQFMKDPLNMKLNEISWKPINTSEEHTNCLIFRNSDNGDQEIGKLPDEVTNRVRFWKDHGIPPYQDYD